MLVRLFNFMLTVLRVCTCVYSVTKKKKNCFLISVYYQQMMHAMDSRCIKFPDITSPRSDTHIDDTFLSRKFRNRILQGTRFTWTTWVTTIVMPVRLSISLTAKPTSQRKIIESTFRKSSSVRYPLHGYILWVLYRLGICEFMITRASITRLRKRYLKLPWVRFIIFIYPFLGIRS